VTCGLRNSQNPTADNLNPQETTNQTAPDMGLDGAELSCPGSSVVANLECESERFELADPLRGLRFSRPILLEIGFPLSSEYSR
jgi:hypothetical protein